MSKLPVYIGFDKRPAEVQAYAVAAHSIARRARKVQPVISGLVLEELKRTGMYRRPVSRGQDGKLWDVISDAPMSTEFSISRFLVPIIEKRGWALFVDADVMARCDIGDILEEADPSKACMVVRHANYTPVSGTKMDGQIQTAYARKNWSSVVLWNCDHKSTQKLTRDMVNAWRGLALHQFEWLQDDEIGALDPKWNWLVGYSSSSINPALVHFTDGTPAMRGHEYDPFAAEWWEELKSWAHSPTT